MRLQEPAYLLRLSLKTLKNVLMMKQKKQQNVDERRIIPFSIWGFQLLTHWRTLLWENVSQFARGWWAARTEWAARWSASCPPAEPQPHCNNPIRHTHGYKHTTAKTLITAKNMRYVRNILSSTPVSTLKWYKYHKNKLYATGKLTGIKSLQVLGTVDSHQLQSTVTGELSEHATIAEGKGTHTQAWGEHATLTWKGYNLW